MNDIRGLKPFIAFAPNWGHWALLGLGLLIVAAGAHYWFGRPRTASSPEAVAGVPTPPLQPRSVREQLDRLRASRWIENGRVRDFHGRLSAIVRGFLGTRFQLPGRRLTTTELLAELARGPIDQVIFQEVADFLTLCDLAKFAGARPPAAEMLARLETAYLLVERLGDASTADEEADDEAGDRGEGVSDALG